ncbi:MAG: DUF4271 domain-containing protein [Pedobacter sp.]|nr:MAG: DUF4271 domain-containing protein [Pedobacter sp.]
MPKFIFILFAFLLCSEVLLAQQTPVNVDSVSAVKYQYRRYRLDSAAQARQKFVTDSIVKHTWALPDSLLNKTILLDSVEKEFLFPSLDIIAWQKKYQHLKKKANPYQLGSQIPKGNVGLLGFIFVLLVIFAILKNAFSKQLSAIVQSFFSNRILNNINKEDNLFSSWPFLLLFVQFGFVFGMFFFLVAQWRDMYQAKDGFKFFFTISLTIIAFYALKLVLLRFLGFLFNVQKPVGEYISILYLSYFNASLLFIPLVVSFALSPLKYGEVYIVLAVLLLGVIFTFQLLRAGVTILSNNKFSKMHLFLYFCALEICPILILIKTIGL